MFTLHGTKKLLDRMGHPFGTLIYFLIGKL